ncbi:phage T7 F exclusion suppressor FxsA [Paraliobacillus sp. PM-2]|uniref:FxsA family protein n=1 Tax=Paraliobacillus sp. PM-2 TaxID=1462524 RepID=UPI00061C8686|nr:FxsA family protein [Paraliobacillus sp. PM-2]CQR48114.1 phage T7 F exclusion suppressor FxsA [Paraliobacillus sp. PM-2]
MFRWLFLLIIIVPALEIGIFVWAGNIIGAWWVIFFIILTGVFGAYLAKREGLQTLRLAQREMSYGRLPAEQIFDGICILIGAVVLLTPGFITDTIGFLLLLPTTRKPLKHLLQQMLQSMLNKGTITIFRR